MPQSTQDLFAELKYIQQTFSCASQIAQVHNLVGTCVLRSDNFKLDLHTISRLLPNTVFEKQKFAAITMRIGQPTCTVLLFTSGKMVLTGCKSYIDCVIASLHILYLMRSNFPGVVFNIHHHHGFYYNATPEATLSVPPLVSPSGGALLGVQVPVGPALPSWRIVTPRRGVRGPGGLRPSRPRGVASGVAL